MDSLYKGIFKMVGCASLLFSFVTWLMSPVLIKTPGAHYRLIAIYTFFVACGIGLCFLRRWVAILLDAVLCLAVFALFVDLARDLGKESLPAISIVTSSIFGVCLALPIVATWKGGSVLK